MIQLERAAAPSNDNSAHGSLSGLRGAWTKWGERVLAMAAGIIDHCQSVQARLALHRTPPRWTLL